MRKKRKKEKNQRITNHLSKKNFIKHATYKVDLPLKIASFVFVIVSFGHLVLILFLLEWWLSTLFLAISIEGFYFDENKRERERERERERVIEVG